MGNICGGTPKPENVKMVNQLKLNLEDFNFHKKTRFIADYTMGKTLGNGAYGLVREC